MEVGRNSEFLLQPPGSLRAHQVRLSIRGGGPKDWVGWFQHHPYLKAEKPKPVTVGSVRGVQLDVVPEVPEKYFGSYCRGIDNVTPTDCVDIAPYQRGTGPGLVAWEEGVKERVIVLEDVKGETVVIDFGAPPGKKFDEFTSGRRRWWTA